LFHEIYFLSENIPEKFVKIMSHTLYWKPPPWFLGGGEWLVGQYRRIVSIYLLPCLHKNQLWIMSHICAMYGGI